MRTRLVAIGRLHGPMAELCSDYAKRLRPKLEIREIVAPSPQAEQAALAAAVSPSSFLVALDERGKDLSSLEFAEAFRRWRDVDGVEDLCFVIGGADGLGDALRARAGLLLGLGRKTWPHALARVLLIEQIYRAQQILAGHPYHRG